MLTKKELLACKKTPEQISKIWTSAILIPKLKDAHKRGESSLHLRLTKEHIVDLKEYSSNLIELESENMRVSVTKAILADLKKAGYTIEEGSLADYALDTKTGDWALTPIPSIEISWGDTEESDAHEAPEEDKKITKEDIAKRLRELESQLKTILEEIEKLKGEV